MSTFELLTKNKKLPVCYRIEFLAFAGRRTIVKYLKLTDEEYLVLDLRMSKLYPINDLTLNTNYRNHFDMHRMTKVPLSEWTYHLDELNVNI